MKNLKTYILSLFLLAAFQLLPNLSYGQAWQVKLASDPVIAEVAPTPDGGFVATETGGPIVSKVDGQGSLLWSYSLTGNYDNQFGQSLVVLADGSIVVAGEVFTSTPSFQAFAFLIKLDDSGALVWEQYYPATSPSGGAYLVSAIPSGGFFVGGQYDFLIKTDDAGNELWRKTSYGMRGLEATADGGGVYLVNDNTTGSDLLFVRKVDSNGDAVWSQSFSGNDDLVGRQMTTTSDGGFAITGFDYDGNASDYFILKIDAAGNLEFLQHFGSNTNDVGQSIDQTQDGGYLVTGWSALAGRVTRLTKLDTQGNVQWERDYGSGEGLSVKELANGAIIMAARGLRLFYLNADGSIYENLIKGKIVEDLNADCNFQTGELGLEGWTVWADGPVRNFAKTDNLGNFEIEVDTGTFVVTPSIPGFVWQPCVATLATTLPTEPDTSDVGTFLMESVTATMTTISGYVYQDLDGDCVQDPGEPGIPNCPLWAATEENMFGGGPQLHTITDANGFYSFTVDAGDYYGVGLEGFNNPFCSTCEPDFFEYVTAVPVTNNIGVHCMSGPPQHVTGLVFLDENENCMFDFGEPGLNLWDLDIVKQGTTDTLKIEGDMSSNGEFTAVLDTGTYYFIITPPNYLFLPCQTVQIVQVLPNGTPPVLFPLMPFAACPKMTVDIGTPVLRPCTESTYTVQYCNEGTVVANDASIEIALPTGLVFGSSQLPATALPNNTWSFDLGDVEPGECNSFWLKATLDCDEPVGLTYCVEAHVFPDSLCTDTSQFWDGSSVEVFANCEGDSVVLTIMNNGWGDMSEPLQFIVVEDNVLIRDSTFQLQSGGATDVVVYPNGATIVLQAQQSFAHPGNSAPIIFVEGCGGDSISIGFVTQYPQNDADCFIAIDCRESVNAFDPNIKEAQPRGITDAHFITPQTDLEYQITFQNLGTASAVEVVILDTLSQTLDTATLRTGVASHDYNWELLPGNILKFTFENINLPHASADSIGSIGFVKYQIGQNAGNGPGTLIENRAGIYFDFNDVVMTNTVDHRIPEPEMFDHQTVSLCSGEEYNGQVFTENTVLADTINYAFFDSIFTTEIKVLPVSESEITDGICEGEIYEFNGEILTTAGQYEAVLQNENGCDSTITLDLEVYPDQSATIDTALVSGSVLFGVPVFSDTTFTQVMTDAYGCFYTLTFNVEIVVSANEKSNHVHLTLSPNPTNGDFLISGQMPVAGKVSAILYNAFGQEVQIVVSEKYFTKKFVVEVNGQNIPPATYYLLMIGEGWSKVSKVVVF